MLELAAGEAHATVSEADGGRLASLVVAGRERLVLAGAGRSVLHWGAFPMVPWAGRIRHGRFRFDGQHYALPATFEGHAIHGVGYDRPWTVLDDTTLAVELGPPWPFGGHAVARFALAADRLQWTLEVHADARAMPAQAGWHPWFTKPATLHFEPGRMYIKDPDGVPTGELVPPTPGPWDDCFREVDRPPELTWADGVTLTVHSDADHWVVFDQPSFATCVEPQTGPPDGFTLAPAVITPGHPLVTTMELRWR